MVCYVFLKIIQTDVIESATNFHIKISFQGAIMPLLMITVSKISLNSQEKFLISLSYLGPIQSAKGKVFTGARKIQNCVAIRLTPHLNPDEINWTWHMADFHNHSLYQCWQYFKTGTLFTQQNKQIAINLTHDFHFCKSSQFVGSRTIKLIQQSSVLRKGKSSLLLSSSVRLQNRSGSPLAVRDSGSHQSLSATQTHFRLILHTATAYFIRERGVSQFIFVPSVLKGASARSLHVTCESIKHAVCVYK